MFLVGIPLGLAIAFYGLWGVLAVTAHLNTGSGAVGLNPSARMPDPSGLPNPLVGVLMILLGAGIVGAAYRAARQWWRRPR